jgi:RHS repeat-associated protein
VQSYEYSPYGEVLSSEGSVESPYQYAGEEFDEETGLLYLRARYYDPETDRFISRDPVRGTLDNSLSQNPYAYALDNPVMYSDPSGEFIVQLLFGLFLPIVEDPCTDLNPSAEQIANAGQVGNWLFIADILSGGIGGAGGKGALSAIQKSVAGFSEGQLKMFERQLVESGVQSLQKSRSSLQGLIVEHLEKIAKAKAKGGFTSSMETEIRNFQRQINAINEILKGF